MIRGHHLNRVLILMIMTSAGHSQKLAPVIEWSCAVGVHRTMNHHGRHPCLMGLGDALDIGFVLGIRKAFIVNHDVKLLGPILLVIESNLSTGPVSTLVNHRPVNFRIG